MVVDPCDRDCPRRRMIRNAQEIDIGSRNPEFDQLRIGFAMHVGSCRMNRSGAAYTLTARALKRGMSLQIARTNPAGRRMQPDLADSPLRACYHAPINCLPAPFWHVRNERIENKWAIAAARLLSHRCACIRFRAPAALSRGWSARSLREANIPLSPLLAKAGLTVEQIDDDSARLKASSQIKFLALAADCPAG